MADDLRVLEYSTPPASAPPRDLFRAAAAGAAVGLLNLATIAATPGLAELKLYRQHAALPLRV